MCGTFMFSFFGPFLQEDTWILRSEGVHQTRRGPATSNLPQLTRGVGGGTVDLMSNMQISSGCY